MRSTVVELEMTMDEKTLMSRVPFPHFFVAGDLYTSFLINKVQLSARQILLAQPFDVFAFIFI